MARKRNEVPSYTTASMNAAIQAVLNELLSIKSMLFHLPF